MFSRSYFVAIGFLALTCFSVPDIARGESLTVATFNTEFLLTHKVHVKYGFKYNMSENPQAVRDQWSPVVFRTQRFEEAVDAVAEVIADIDTDVLVLTEVGDGSDLASLVNAIQTHGTTYPYYEVCECNDRNTGQHVAILSKRPFLASETMLSLPGRAAFDAEVDDPDEQKDTGVSKGMRVSSS